MLNLSSTRLAASGASERAVAEVCPEPALPTATTPYSSRSACCGSSQPVQRLLKPTTFRPRSPASAPGKVYSIPIQPPR
jgi:hypothetical protein